MKITLNNVGSLIDATTAATIINANFQAIQTAWEDNLSRDGTAPNQLEATLDANSQAIINLPAPIAESSPVRLQDLSSSGNGAVASVGLAMPADFTVTNSPVTTTGTLTAAWQTPPSGTGAVVRATSAALTTPTITSPILVTPALGAPASGVMTNVTGTAAGLTAGHVTTNANLTGDVTSVGNATTLATVNGSPGSFGSATATPTITFNGKGLATAVNSVTVTPAVGSITGLGTGVGTFLATPTSANLAAAITNETGTGLLVFNASPALTTPVITGTATNNNAAAGVIGEYISSTVAVGSAVPLTTGTAANVTSISLTAGDWDVSGTVAYSQNGTAAAATTGLAGGITTTTATLPSALPGVASAVLPATGGLAFVENVYVAIAPIRFSLASTTTVFLTARATFSAGTTAGYGFIGARRSCH